MDQNYSFEQEEAEAAEFEKEVEKELGEEGAALADDPEKTGDAGEKGGGESQDDRESGGDGGGDEKKLADESASEGIAGDESHNTQANNSGAPPDEQQQTKKKIPPEGYVEIQALKETRENLKKVKDAADQLKAENEALAIQLKEALSGQGQSQQTGFKELSADELEMLKEEDPDEYNEYRFQLIEHRETQKRVAEAERISLREVHEAASVVNELTSDRAVVDELINHGTASGFTAGDLAALSQPQTKIVTGDGKTRYLGKAAVAFIRQLDATRRVDKATVEADVEARLRPILVEQITKELLTKFKNNDGQTTLVGQGDKEFKKQLPARLTEAQFAKLSPKEQEEWLKG